MIVLGAALCALLAACGEVPGMQMDDVQMARRDHGTQALSSRPVPVLTDITLATINRMSSELRQANDKAAVELSGANLPYTLGPADVLQITVWDHPELAIAQGSQNQTAARPSDPPAGFVVDQAGDIQFPFAGSVSVEGLTPAQIQKKIVAALTVYFQDPQVTVRVASFRSRQVYVDGEVHAPGIQLLNDVPMTLAEAIGRAGGFTDNADQGRVLLTRSGQTYVLDVAVTRGGQGFPDLTLRRGDMVRVMPREESGVFVMGEVNRPVTAVPREDGRLMLADALSQAGSFNPGTSSPQQLYVIRGVQESGMPQVFHLDARSPVAMMLASRFPLEPNDIVYVDASDLVRFNRVLSLLLPAIDAGLTAAVVTK
ncbi:polysaccharide biosynthesis/export family protein [Paraburkholderia sp. BCC1885]|uniref:polysaccharide biosynthesis/export family protein n=1 Tax=Paraburkholderia sp. BCC1885 TaxID=2562669 RepID=UPI0021B3A61E|nr:polysaccharide biosynthesis/export family protein [Paraburkholderia sp. BCC1885]